MTEEDPRTGTTAYRDGDDWVDRIIRANGVDLCTATLGDPTDPPILLVGNSMLTWHDGLCERLAAGQELPRRIWPVVVAAVLRHSSAG